MHAYAHTYAHTYARTYIRAYIRTYNVHTYVHELISVGSHTIHASRCALCICYRWATGCSSSREIVGRRLPSLARSPSSCRAFGSVGLGSRKRSHQRMHMHAFSPMCMHSSAMHWVSHVHCACATGVQYDEPVGKNDGSVKGRRCFECSPEFGGFLRPDHIRPDAAAAPTRLLDGSRSNLAEQAAAVAAAVAAAAAAAEASPIPARGGRSSTRLSAAPTPTAQATAASSAQATAAPGALLQAQPRAQAVNPYRTMPHLTSPHLTIPHLTLPYLRHSRGVKPSRKPSLKPSLLKRKLCQQHPHRRCWQRHRPPTRSRLGRWRA